VKLSTPLKAGSGDDVDDGEGHGHEDQRDPHDDHHVPSAAALFGAGLGDDLALAFGMGDGVRGDRIAHP
jgi:hypothetical protein